MGLTRVVAVCCWRCGVGVALVVCVLFLSRENKNTTQRIPCGFCCPQREQRGYQPCRISSFLFDKAWSKPLALRLPLRADVAARCRVAHRSVNVEISHSSSRVAATLGQAPQQSPHSLQNSTEYISNVHGGFHAAQRRGYLYFLLGSYADPHRQCCRLPFVVLFFFVVHASAAS